MLLIKPFFHFNIFLSFVSPKERTKKKTARKPNQACSCRTSHHVNAEKLAVRTFRGNPAHRSDFKGAHWPEKVAGATSAYAGADNLFLIFLLLFVLRQKVREPD